MLRGERDADAEPDGHRLSVEQEGGLEGGDQALGQGDRVVAHLRAGLDDGELVAAQARDQIGLAQAAVQPLRRAAQETVADGVPKGVVDLLEAVEVEAERGEADALGEARGGLFEALAEDHAVGQPRQRVAARHGDDALLGLVALRHVLVGGDPAAFGRRLLLERNDAVGADRAAERPARPLLHQSLLLQEQVDRTVVIRGRGDDVGDVAQGHPRPQRARLDAEHVAEAAVVDEQAAAGIVEAQALEHVAQRRVELRVAALELILLLLEQGDVAAHGNEAAVPGRTPADAQPAPVGGLGLGGRGAGAGHGQQRVGGGRATCLRERVLTRLRGIEAEQGGRPGIGQHDPSRRVGDHDALDGGLDRIGEQGLRRAALRDLLLHHRRDVAAHHRHRAQERAELVVPALGHLHGQLAGRDAARHRRGVGDRPHDLPRQEQGHDTREHDRHQGRDDAQPHVAGHDRPGGLPIGEAVAGGEIDEQVEVLLGHRRMGVEGLPDIDGLPIGAEFPARREPLGHCVLGGGGLLRGPLRLRPFGRDLDIFFEGLRQRLDPRFERAPLVRIAGKARPRHRGLQGGEIGRRGTRVIDGHQRAVVGLIDQGARGHDAERRVSAEERRDGAQHQEGEKDSTANGPTAAQDGIDGCAPPEHSCLEAGQCHRRAFPFAGRVSHAIVKVIPIDDAA